MVKKKTKKTIQTNLVSRPPVVVVLGHVDHGKTAILDFIRKTSVVEKEAGGITQHIGAYEIEHQGKKITFIDTPGHEAFGAMRSRGARVADIAILVVAAEEGVKPQTKEAISHIKEAGIPMIVALNKIDKPQADPERAKRELGQADVLVESMGGEIPSVNLSAKEGTGIPDLLELILLVAEMQNLETSLSEPAQGVVIESHMDSSRGPTATLILTGGILETGQIVATPSTLGSAKILEDFQGSPVAKAAQSMPVVLIGFNDVPRVGETFKVFPCLEAAKKNIKAAEEKEETPLPEGEEDKKVLNLILKADVLGSIEAIEEVLKALPQDTVALRILKKGVGEINETDVKLAKGNRALILGFRVGPDPIAQKLFERDKVRMKSFDVIYELFQYIKERMEKLLSSKVVRKDLGKLKVLLVFRTEKKRQIVGGKIIEGGVERGAKIEVFRGEEILGPGKMISLQKNKKNIEKAGKGEEVGILYEGEVKIQEDDILVFFVEEREREEL